MHLFWIWQSFIFPQSYFSDPDYNNPLNLTIPGNKSELVTEPEKNEIALKHQLISNGFNFYLPVILMILKIFRSFHCRNNRENKINITKSFIDLYPTITLKNG